MMMIFIVNHNILTKNNANKDAFDSLMIATCLKCYIPNNYMVHPFSYQIVIISNQSASH